ncbi:MAG: class I SAM-dependent rRNA methyltransferase [Bacteroidales bacterium]|jgi:23S rRNA (cytosine1962-C5)-methyltransferase|nr:class I SAM-dependent rRNA methyltransferase [Bacteroidales bacterium]
MSETVKIVLKSGKDQSLRRRHPWVFSGAIKKIYGQAAEGEIVDVYDNKDEKLGSGHFQTGSIAIRMLSIGDEVIGDDFWNQKIEAAWKHRQEEEVYKPEQTNVFRLVNAEGDGMPGLIIDYYNGAAVIQVHSVGMFKQLDVIVEVLKTLKELPIDTIYNKSKNTLHEQPGIVPVNELLFGERIEGDVLQYGNSFHVNWERGQKTGFFIDQRENRKLLEHYSKGKKVLNMFCFSGGFSVYALRGGAELVHSVDSSGHAVDLTRLNIDTNFPEQKNHEAFATDAFEYLQNIDQKYDVIILDPPAFAKHQRVLNNALQGYKKLNQQSIAQISPGGVIFTFSCSQAVSKENFRKSVFAAAANTGRNVRVLHQMTQPTDHPVSIYHPEGEYLKGLVLKVD